MFQFEMIVEATRRHELREPIRALYRRYTVALGTDSNRDPALSRALFASLDGLMLQFFSHAITADELRDAVRALAAAVRS
ncbi:hypothetical protein [Georgenia alba]|uniref:Tetracyclin repressor-like C-terminal group 31 domain-containing protein n=1 Tax=Georgenia alba TaxID=2233858 RepID=A0ABW2Q627_9MICO